MADVSYSKIDGKNVLRTTTQGESEDELLEKKAGFEKVVTEFQGYIAEVNSSLELLKE